MKKLIVLVLIAGLLLTGTMVYAEEAAGTDVLANESEFKDIKAEMKPLIDTIRSNSAEIEQLREDATALYKETKEKVKELINSEDGISQAQIEAIKEAIDILVEDKKLLVETKGDILKESIDLRVARRDRDVEAFKEALENIISIQNTRIEIFNKIIEDLKAVGTI
ncbi:MAG: hypothetical protein FIA99_15525 [Ruminiclostridium sp.]|nr:hypothetical protein [Ruminiclostridium sp.]